MDKSPTIWGTPSPVFFDGLTQLEFFKRRFSSIEVELAVEEGPSHINLAKYPDDHFDLIYVDGDHTYDGVKLDAELSVKKVKRGGLIIFNDYILFCNTQGEAYGVIPVVNELVIRENCQVIGFALQRHMFCDIAIQRPL
ncbi:MAG: class I SAM-dependent methyltransferase [Alphaproteobacteria bacterium]|nr:class I SAM-dependent methyltransferase [Alphaproteobacteria bacterium]